jgi:hypothetical protein
VLSGTLLNTDFCLVQISAGSEIARREFRKVVRLGEMGRFSVGNPKARAEEKQGAKEEEFFSRG